MKRRALVLLCIIPGMIACVRASPIPTATTPIETPVTETAAPIPATAIVTPAIEFTRESPYLRDFERAWNAVYTRYFDTSFGGVDWQGLHDDYEPLNQPRGKAL